MTDAHAWPRPVDARVGAVRYAVGLGRTPPDATRLATLTRAWVAGTPGVQVDRVDGGDLSPLC